jgi:hypothetical protein
MRANGSSRAQDARAVVDDDDDHEPHGGLPRAAAPPAYWQALCSFIPCCISSGETSLMCVASDQWWPQGSVTMP